MRLIKIMLFIAFCFLLACTENKKQTPTLDIEKKEKFANTKKFEIPVYTFDEFKYLLNQKNDTTYVVNFWATWCKPCIEELPYFEALHTKYKNEAVKVILVSLDFVGQTQKVVDFINKKDLKSAVVHLNDSNNSEWIDKVHKNWSGSIPATYVYKNDKVNFYEQSFENLEELTPILTLK